MTEHDSAPIEPSEEALEKRRQMQALVDSGQAGSLNEAHHMLMGRPPYPPIDRSKPSRGEKEPTEERHRQRSLLPGLFIIDPLE